MQVGKIEFNNQKTPEELMSFHSGQLMMMLDECRHSLNEISDELAEAICTYKTLERMLPHELAVLKEPLLDLGIGRNEAMDRAMASDNYRELLNRLNEAYDRKKELEIKYDIFINNIKAITALTYLKNQELKSGI